MLTEPEKDRSIKLQTQRVLKSQQLREVINAHKKQEQFLGNFHDLHFDYKQTEIYKSCLEKLHKIDESFLP